MKYKILIVLFAVSVCSYGQTKDNKNNLSFGGGSESYNGDLGNTWFNIKEEWYGFYSLNYARYLTPSFDINITTTIGDYGKCVDDDEYPYWSDGTPILNMYARLTTGIISIKYKFAK